MWSSSRILAVALLCFSSVPAVAFVDVGARYGARWYDMDKGGGSAYTGLTLDGHLALLPILKVGLNLSKFAIADRDKGGDDSVDLTELGLDAVVTIPFIPIVTPYARLSLVLMSEFSGKGKTGSSSYEYTNSAQLLDPLYTVGLAYSPLPFLSLTLEASQGVHMVSLDEYKASGVDQASGHAKDAHAATVQSVMMGVMVSI